LARGEIQCIGATTFDEYKKHIEKDAALVRRFQKIILNEPTETETVEILKNLKSSYENFHLVTYDDNVIETIVKLSGRFITDRQFPDKSIDIMDELGSEKKISAKLPPEIDLIKLEIEKINEQKKLVVKSQNYEDAARLRDEEKKLLKKINDVKTKFEENHKLNKKSISIDDVYHIITEMTGVPIAKLDNKETEKLLKMEEILNKRVIGQEEAISIISKSIRRNRVGIKDTNKPIGSFMFLGSTGVGKCICGDTEMTVRNKVTGEIKIINIKNIVPNTN
jgi:ATP-dependent Clp protease ATP-binding subunit ClpC